MNERRDVAILIVQDENVVAQDVESSLEHLGYKVAGITGRSEEAIALAASASPSLVLMDIQLRGDVDGVEAAEVIRQRHGLPVLYLTAHSDEATLRRARATNPYGYVVKPFEEQELDVAIQMALYRHEMETALRATEARTRAILETAPDAIITADSEGRITGWNESAERVFGYTAPEAVGKPLTLLIPSRYQSSHARAFERAVEAGRVTAVGQTRELHGLRRDGEEFALELSLSSWEHGGKVYFSAVARDISERKHVQEILQQELDSKEHDVQALALELAARKRELQTALEATHVAKEHAERASQVKSHFLGLASHELRSPLTSVLLQLYRLRREGESVLTPELSAVVERIGLGLQRLQGVVENVLHYSRIEAGRVSIDVEVIGVPALARQVFEELRPQAEAKGLTLELVCPGELAPLHSDPRIVRLVLAQLLDNAVKFTEEGRVTLSVQHGEDRHRFAVQDTGPGIEPAKRAQMFRPFEVGEPLNEKHTRGLGLGLALVRALVDSLEGDVMVTSHSGTGSTVEVVLPQLDLSRSATDGKVAADRGG